MVSSKKRILVAEDDPLVREFVAEALLLQGYHVETAFGVGALAASMAHPPDLLILDLMMPDMDGFTVREELAKNISTKWIPIIVMTAFRSPERRFREIKPAGWLQKPFGLETLYALVENILGV